MGKPLDRARMIVQGTPGKGTVRLRSPATGYVSFADAGAEEGDILTVLFEDGNEWEISSCTFSPAAQTLVRSFKKSSSGELLSLSPNATASVIADADDLRGVIYSLGILPDAGVAPQPTDRIGGVAGAIDQLFTVEQVAETVGRLVTPSKLDPAAAITASDTFFGDQGANPVGMTAAQLREFMSNMAGLPLANFRASRDIIAAGVTSYQPGPEETGSIKFTLTASAFALTLPASMPPGFHFTIVQWGAGVITPTALAPGYGPFNSEGFTKSKRYGALSFFVVDNPTGNDATWAMFGVGVL